MCMLSTPTNCVLERLISKLEDLAEGNHKAEACGCVWLRINPLPELPMLPIFVCIPSDGVTILCGSLPSVQHIRYYIVF